MASRKKTKSSRGRRYTAEEKSNVIEYVEKVNASKGRGGQTAAANKFGISMLTISSWIKKAPAAARPANGKSKSKPESKSKPKSKSKPEAKSKSKSMNGALSKLATLHSQIQAKEKELVKLRQQFDVLKRSL